MYEAQGWQLLIVQCMPQKQDIGPQKQADHISFRASYQCYLTWNTGRQGRIAGAFLPLCIRSWRAEQRSVKIG